MNKTLILFLLLVYGCNLGDADSTPAQKGTHKAIATSSNNSQVPSITAPEVVYRSVDLGKSWSPFAQGIPKEATLSGIKQQGNQLFVTTDYHGVFVSHGGLNNWEKRNEGLPEKVDINCLEAKGAQLVIGTLNQGTFVSEDGGMHWRASTKNIEQSRVRAFFQNHQQLIAGTDQGIFRSEDMGNTWLSVMSGRQILGFTALKGKLYAAAHNGALMSTDNGLTWTAIYNDDALHDIGNDGEYVYAMTIGQSLLKTNNDGLTWETAQNGIPRPPNFYTNELVHQGIDVFSAQWIGIYHSSDHGQNWKQLGDLPAATAFSTLEMTDFGIIAGIAIR